MLLTPHFTSQEFACRCCGHVGSTDLRPLAWALEALRGVLGGRPIHLRSGYRCPAHNAAVGGVADSQHPKGHAADIVVYGLTPEQIAAAAEHVPAFARGGIGLYDDFVHVDIRDGMARWDNRTHRPRGRRKA